MRLRLIKTQRVLQVVLGLFWILDAALQFQPYMFTKAFVNDNILASASGQPNVVDWVITKVGHFIDPHVAVWNTFFALIQLAIGAGLLFRRTVRPALAVSFLWVLGVWVFGEGLGDLFTGTASALTGAPGSVLLYGALGLLAWPRTAAPEAADGAGAGAGGDELWVASSAGGQGLGGSVTPLVVWSGFWALSAVLFLLPANRTKTSVSSAIIGMAPGTPSWFSRFLTDLGHDFTSTGTQTSWILAALCVIIAVGTLVSRRPGLFLALGGLLAAAMWIAAQGFIGGIFTGSGTDPNTGPLVVVLALALVPAAAAQTAAWRSPLRRLASWNPVLTAGAGGALVVALVLSAAYPAPASESTSTAMSGMADMSGAASGSGATASTASCSSGNGGVARSGLDLNNTPYMIMSGRSLGMDMNGADASAAAGLNSTKSNWSYTGPALASSLARLLLADGGNTSGDIHMADTGCAAEPTASQEINAIQYVQSTSEAVSRYEDPLAALADGYVAVSSTTYPVVYYVNPSIVAANAAAKRTMDPKDVDGLVYVKTPSGSEVLAAALYLLPSTRPSAPMPYGALVQWHQRTAVCSTIAAGATPLDITGVTPCAAGTVQRATPYMTMVWQVPVAGGPLAIQPPDIQIVEAAIMQQAAG
jgi:hypothetical protein